MEERASLKALKRRRARRAERLREAAAAGVAGGETALLWAVAAKQKCAGQRHEWQWQAAEYALTLKRWRACGRSHPPEPSDAV